VFGKERCNGLLGVLGGGGERDAALVVGVAVAIAQYAVMVVIVVAKFVIMFVFVFVLVGARSGLLSHGDWRGGSHS
jgi:hypothetical protein